MKTKLMICVLTLGVACSSAFAQYVGPNGSATSVKQVQESSRNYAPVLLQGYITGRVMHDDLYQFKDGTGTIQIKIDHKDWPAGLNVDEKTRVEIAGKYDQDGGFNKIKVNMIRKVD